MLWVLTMSVDRDTEKSAVGVWSQPWSDYVHGPRSDSSPYWE